MAKLGGKELRRSGNHRVIALTQAAAKQLRRHEAVLYLQRIWMGESLEGWDEKYSAATTGPRIASEADTDLTWSVELDYDGSGNIKTMTEPGKAPDSFTYDTAGRLIQAVVSGKSETYQYDAFGNLLEMAVAGRTPVTIPVDGGSNRVTGTPYDAAWPPASAASTRMIL